MGSARAQGSESRASPPSAQSLLDRPCPFPGSVLGVDDAEAVRHPRVDIRRHVARATLPGIQQLRVAAVSHG
jgi:hypothetical protein